MDARVVWPFLVQILEKKPEGYKPLIGQLFENDDYRLLATVSVLQDGSVEELVSIAVTNAPAAWRNIETLVLRGEIKESILGQLLRHANPDLAVAVAWGLWHCDPVGEISVKLMTDWKNAIINSHLCDRPLHQIDDILESNPDLAFRWVSAFLDPSNQRLAIGAQTIDRIGELCVELSKQQKSKLITALSPIGTGNWIVAKIIGQDLELYRQLLAREDLNKFHLQPLEEFNLTSWPDFVIAATDSGLSVQHIAQTTFRMSNMWQGNESDMHKERVKLLQRVDVERHNSLAEVVAKLLEWEQANLEDCLARERHEAVFGER